MSAWVGSQARAFPSTAGQQQHSNEEYTSKYDYQATNQDEISLTVGMKLLVIQKEEDGWWRGKCVDQPDALGWFPANYVVKSPTPTPSNTPSAAPQTNDTVLMVARTLYSYAARFPEELTFEQYELLDIIEDPPNDPEWWLARNSDGSVGIVPKNYVEKQPENIKISHSNYDRVTASFNNERAASPVREVKPVQPVGRGGPEFSGKRWYFGAMSRLAAEKILKERAQVGQFLVRNSESVAGEFSISLKTSVKLRHFKVNVLPDGQFGIGQRKFGSMDELLEHYIKSPIFTSKQDKSYLTGPVRK